MEEGPCAHAYVKMCTHPLWICVHCLSALDGHDLTAVNQPGIIGAQDKELEDFWTKAFNYLMENGPNGKNPGPSQAPSTE